MDKQRLDVYLFENAFVDSREKARALIMAGEVKINGRVADKAGTAVKPDDVVVLKSDKLKYVSRGGLKLEKALKVFDIYPDGYICMDVGASTGGFTDCLLQNGAKKVYSIDVGYAQLAYTLRTDERVVSIEKMNFRYMPRESITETPELIVTDVSFISLTKLADKFREFADSTTALIALIKPQFESQRDSVGKKGVISDPKEHLKILVNVLNALKEAGIFIKKLDFSPIKGPKGNIEFIALFGFDKTDHAEGFDIVSESEKCVERAHSELNNKNKGDAIGQD